jgi:ribosome-associated protein
MERELDLGRGITIPLSEVAVRFSRSSGPGGQNVNRRATRVEAIFDLANTPALTPAQRARAMRALRKRLDAEGRVRVVAQGERSQAQNRVAAIEELRRLLAGALRPPPPPRVPTRPTKAARERRLAGKRARATIKKARAKPDDD